MPPDDPLYHGAWEHDHAVGELQGKAVRQLVVETSLTRGEAEAEHSKLSENISVEGLRPEEADNLINVGTQRLKVLQQNRPKGPRPRREEVEAPTLPG